MRASLRPVAAAAILGFCWAGAVGTAHAAASASASIGTVSITLIDLDPLDGIAPSLTFSGESSQSSGYVGDPYAYDFMSASGFYTPTSALASSTTGWSSGSTSANGATSSTMLYGSTASGVYNYSNSSGYSYGQFTVTPWTLVILTTSYDVEAMTTIGTDGVNYESSQGGAQLEMNIAGQDGWEYHLISRYVSASHMWDGIGYVPTSDAASGQMTLSVANVAETEVSGSFYAYAYTSAGSSIAAVPEPGTYAMLLAGLAGIGTMVRRRRR